MGYEERNGESDDETLPESEQWTTHRTQPTVGFFADWSLRYEKLVWMLTPTYKHNWGSLLSLVDNRPQEAELCQREMKTWHPDLSQVETDGGDKSSKEWRILGLMHTAVSVSLLSCTSDRLQYSFSLSLLHWSLLLILRPVERSQHASGIWMGKCKFQQTGVSGSIVGARKTV
jgi:hypothetical protein